jgi:hypothetical protein
MNFAAAAAEQSPAEHAFGLLLDISGHFEGLCNDER